MSAPELPLEVVEEIVEHVARLLTDCFVYDPDSVSFVRPYLRSFTTQRHLLDLRRVSKTWGRACILVFDRFFTLSDDYTRDESGQSPLAKAQQRLHVLRSLPYRRLRSVQVLCLSLEEYLGYNNSPLEDTHLMDPGLSVVVARLRQLRALTIWRTSCLERFPALSSSLAMLSQLSSLNIRVQDSDEVLSTFIDAFGPSLEELHIKVGHLVSERTVRRILSMPKLQSLELGLWCDLYDLADYPLDSMLVVAPITRLSIHYPLLYDGVSQVYLGILRARAPFLKQLYVHGQPPPSFLRHAVAGSPAALAQVEDFCWLSVLGLGDVLNCLSALRPPKLKRLYFSSSTAVHSRIMLWISSHPLPHPFTIVLLGSFIDDRGQDPEARQALRIFLANHGVELSGRQDPDQSELPLHLRSSALEPRFALGPSFRLPNPISFLNEPLSSSEKRAAFERRKVP